MATRGQVRLKNILKMLRKCAPGYTFEEKTHLHWVRYQGRTFRLPQGKHGVGNNAEIEIGHVRGLVKHLDIDPDCAKRQLPQLA